MYGVRAKLLVRESMNLDNYCMGPSLMLVLTCIEAVVYIYVFPCFGAIWLIGETDIAYQT